MALFGFQSKKKLQERAGDLIITAQVDADLANKTDYFETFMEYYDAIIWDVSASLLHFSANSFCY